MNILTILFQIYLKFKLYSVANTILILLTVFFYSSVFSLPCFSSLSSFFLFPYPHSSSFSLPSLSFCSSFSLPLPIILHPLHLRLDLLNLCLHLHHCLHCLHYLHLHHRFSHHLSHYLLGHPLLAHSKFWIWISDCLGDGIRLPILPLNLTLPLLHPHPLRFQCPQSHQLF